MATNFFAFWSCTQSRGVRYIAAVSIQSNITARRLAFRFDQKIPTSTSPRDELACQVDPAIVRRTSASSVDCRTRVGERARLSCRTREFFGAIRIASENQKNLQSVPG